MALRKYLWKPILNYRHSVIDRYTTIESWESLSEEEIAALSTRRLQSLLDHAYENVPYYREAFDARPAATNLTELPVLEKGDLQQNFEGLKSNDLPSRDWYKNATSGSTGQPTTFVQDSHYASFRDGLKLVFDEWGGRDISDPKVKVWGAQDDLSTGTSVRTKVGNWLRNLTWINAYSMSEDDLRRAGRVINDEKPVTVHAYVEAVTNLASFLEDHDLSVHSPASVMTTAGTLRPEMRAQIERVFDCPVHNRYGSRELGTVASECRYGTGLHYCPMLHHIEILDPTTLEPVEPGETGEIVVTLLTNYSMPLIRYRIGDVGSFRKVQCDCGCRWPLLSNVQGRVTDHFVTPDGTLVYPGALRKALYHYDWIDRFQIHQTSTETVVFRLVSKQHSPPESDLEAISSRAKNVLGTDVTVEFDFPDEIERADSGKYRYTISDVSV
ncbi:phenylacetate--CoA ligase family protein [Natronococcus sp. A-GB1]|uniref:phenylacetate--CoA ligase family protein n=1 Tax=Natronococcus sp. A-GB1 TaxID=3037648 RepID=UPI00241CCDAA|nr:phenylacetate--CoA ligase family protein [Natronococcus sp. A-GB1]MDG5761740.1 phenylacetate--CoA ligase family protein [Natronococcus sp. A-GB1]